MPLPPEIQQRLKSGAVQLPLREAENESGGKAIVEGKTSIPFSTFVQLILKKKVMSLFKDWGDEPIIFSSLLLTKIANAPQDRQEDKNKLILTALTIGLCGGICFSAITLLILWSLKVTVGQRELFVLLGTFLLVGVAVVGASRVHAGKHVAKLTEQIERIADSVGK